MKTRKVLNLRTHIGGLHGKTSYDAKKDEAEMELWPVGVLIKSIKGRPTNILVPFPNVVEAIIAEEDLAEELTKRPGRPPKDAA